MDLSIIERYSRDLAKTLSKNSPTILTAFGVAGLFSTVALAIKATPKAVRIIENEEEFRRCELSDTTPLTPLDVIELTWKEYIPTAIMGSVTVACMIGSNHISNQRNAAIASLFTIAETSLKEYQAKVVETVGEKKAEQIRGSISQDHLDRNPVNEDSVVLTGNGRYLCYDEFSGRYFRSDAEAIRRSLNDFNKTLLDEGWLCLNELYAALDLDYIKMGDDIGWYAENGMVEIRFDSKMAKGTNEPCLVLLYAVDPKYK